MDENDPALPDQVADMPTMRPGSENEVQALALQSPQPQTAPGAAVETAEPAPQPQPTQFLENAPTQQVATAAAPPKRGFLAALFGTQKANASVEPTAQPPQPQVAPDVAVEAVQGGTTAEAVQSEQGETLQADAAQPAQQPEPTQFLENAPAQQVVAAATPAPAKRGFLSALFGAQQASASVQKATQPLLPAAKPAAEPAKPLVQLASATPSAAARPLVDTSANPLPGVRDNNSLFEISRRSGMDDDSDIDLYEDSGPYEVASAAGMARLAPNGLLKQTDHVDVACLKPSLVRMLKTIEGHYGRKIVVTSGYRSPTRNRRARGARNSLHMYCAAADVQVEGISKWDLAAFVRTMPGRGGVGTYCHTNSVHVDVGPERDWNWRCRRRK